MRHAVAERRSAACWPDDSLRPLSDEGAERFRSAARGLATLVPTVDRMLSSPYARAWRTAEILHEETGWPGPERCPALEADCGLTDVLAVLDAATASSLALVGHEPLLSRFASLLLTGDGDLARLELKKGSTVLLELVGGHGPRTAVLRWSVSPKILRRLDPRRT